MSMSSSSSPRRNTEEEGMAPAPADLSETAKVKVGEKKPGRRMTQEQIDRLMRYETVHMPEEAFRRLGREAKEIMTPAELAYQGKLPVPMGQLDDYIANMCREINESEARFMRQRDRMLNDYRTKGYAEEEEQASSPPVPAPVGHRNPNPPGRRRFRPGVTKSKQAGKANKMV